MALGGVGGTGPSVPRGKTGYRVQVTEAAGSWELGARSGGPAFVVSHICQQKADMGHPGFVVSTVE